MPNEPQDNESESPSGTGTGLNVPGATPAVPSGAIAGAGTRLPAGLFTATQALEADVSGELAALSPTFGDVLLSIGDGVAQSQTALDQGVVSTARALSDTNITVVTDVIQELDDDGLPNASATELIQEEVSLINFVTPTVHEWSHVALSMDLSVGAMDNETGLSFDRKQTSGGVESYGLFWGFVGFGLHSSRESTTYTTRSSDRETDWARGQVRMDALLRPRRVENFDPPAQVVIGPQIYFAQGSIQETLTDGAVSARAVDVVITVRKADGAVNPNVTLVLDAGPFDFSFASGGGFTGNTTNADGQIQVTLTRNIPNPRFRRSITATVTASLGQLDSSTQIRL